MALVYNPPERGLGKTTGFRGDEPDAGVPAHYYKPPRGKTSDIRNPETGKRYGLTLISAEAPVEFHSPNDENKAYFETLGKTEVLVYDRCDPANTKERSAGYSSVEKSRAGKLFCGARKHDIHSGPGGKIQNKTIVSADSPRWFSQAVEHNKEFFDKTQDKAWVDAIGIDYAPSKGLAVKNCGKSSGRKIPTALHEDTGQCVSNTIVSPYSPEWMKQTVTKHAEWYKDVTCPAYHAKHDDSYYTYAEMPTGKRCDHFSTGGISAHLVSPKSPRWMKSPIIGNREYFEKETKHKLQEVNRKCPGEEFHSKRIIKEVRDPESGRSVRKNEVSADVVPQWMMPPKTPGSEASSRRGTAQPSSPSKAPPATSPRKAPQPTSSRRPQSSNRARPEASRQEVRRSSCGDRRSPRGSEASSHRSQRGSETERSRRR